MKSLMIFSTALLAIGCLMAVLGLWQWLLNPDTDFVKKNDISLQMAGLPIECNPLRVVEVRPEVCDVLSSYYGNLYKK